jgi:hypothetical protein
MIKRLGSLIPIAGAVCGVLALTLSTSGPAGAQTTAPPMTATPPKTAAPPPTYAASPNGVEQISGTIRVVTGKYTLQLRDSRGFVDNVELHQGTIINPTGLTLAAGMQVTIYGSNGGASFAANQIDAPYTLAVVAPGYGYGAWGPWGYGYGPGWGWGFGFRDGFWR